MTATTPDPATPDPAAPEPATPDPAAPDPAAAEPATPDPAAADAAAPEPPEPAAVAPAPPEPAVTEVAPEPAVTEVAPEPAVTEVAPPSAAAPPEPEPLAVILPADGPSAPELAAALLRGAYGVALCWTPGPIVSLVGGSAATPADRAVARVLGVRHLAQAIVSLARPTPVVLALGSVADVLHSASMIGLAALDRPRWRLGCTDALIAAAFAATGGTLSARRAAATAPAPETAALPALP